MLPGIWMSVNSREMAERELKIDIASSALTASTGQNLDRFDVDCAHAQDHLVFHDKHIGHGSLICRHRSPHSHTRASIGPEMSANATTRPEGPTVRVSRKIRRRGAPQQRAEGRGAYRSIVW